MAEKIIDEIDRSLIETLNDRILKDIHQNVLDEIAYSVKSKYSEVKNINFFQDDSGFLNHFHYEVELNDGKKDYGIIILEIK